MPKYRVVLEAIVTENIYISVANMAEARLTADRIASLTDPEYMELGAVNVIDINEVPDNET